MFLHLQIAIYCCTLLSFLAFCSCSQDLVYHLGSATERIRTGLLSTQKLLKGILNPQQHGADANKIR